VVGEEIGVITSPTHVSFASNSDGVLSPTDSLNILIIIPPLLCFEVFPISTRVIQPFVDSVKLGKIFYMPSGYTMKCGIGLVERAYPDAISTACVILRPELKALLTVHWPFQHPWTGGLI
jgi:hypothetical protein